MTYILDMSSGCYHAIWHTFLICQVHVITLYDIHSWYVKWILSHRWQTFLICQIYFIAQYDMHSGYVKWILSHIMTYILDMSSGFYHTIWHTFLICQVDFITQYDIHSWYVKGILSHYMKFLVKWILSHNMTYVLRNWMAKLCPCGKFKVATLDTLTHTSVVSWFFTSA